MHKVQGLSSDQGIGDFNLKKQKLFGPGQIYTPLGRIKMHNKLFSTRQNKKCSVTVNMDALNE